MYLLDNIYIRFSKTLLRQIAGTCIPMGTNCVPLVADIVFILRKRFHDFSRLSNDNQADIIELNL